MKKHSFDAMINGTPEEWRLRYPKTREEAQTTGEQYFFPDVPCNHRHLYPRRATKTQACVRCQQISHAKYEMEKPEAKVVEVSEVPFKDWPSLPKSQPEAEAATPRSKWYYTGKPCSRLRHICPRRTKSNVCLACADLRAAKLLEQRQLKRSKTLAGVAEEAYRPGETLFQWHEPCVNGHTAPRRAFMAQSGLYVDSVCVECKATSRADAAPAPSKRAPRGAYGLHSSEEKKAYNRNRYHGLVKSNPDPEVAMAFIQEWDRKIADRQQRVAKTYAEKNRDKELATTPEWVTTARLASLLKTLERNARWLGAEGSFTAEDIAGIYQRQRCKCATAASSSR